MSKRTAAAAAAAATAALLLPGATLAFPAFWRRREAPWTGPFTPAEYRAFLNVVALYFGVRRIPVEEKDGVLTIEAPDGTRSEHLQALAEVCRGYGRERWPELIAQHFALPASGGAPQAPSMTEVAPAAPSGPAGPARPADGPADAARDAWPAAAGPAGVSLDAAGAAPAVRESAAFSTMVEECFRRYGFAATVEADGVVARDALGGKQRFDAPGLGLRPQELPREEWRRFIDGIFGESLRALRGTEALAGRGYESVRELLAVQLFDETWLSVAACRATVGARDLPGLLSALVCRLPQATFRVSPRTVGDWGLDSEEVMAAALGNLRGLRPAMERLALAPGLEGMRCETRGPFGAAQALLLGDYAECAGPYGALVAVPRRELLLVCPLRPTPGGAQAVTGAALGLISRIQQSEWEGHTPLARNLYWYRGGQFSDLPYVVQMVDGRPSIDFAPAGAFARAVAEMARS